MDPDETRTSSSLKKDAFQVMQVDLRALNDEWEYTGTGKIAEADLKAFSPIAERSHYGPRILRAKAIWRKL
jgi:hypothetical protein